MSKQTKSTRPKEMPRTGAPEVSNSKNFSNESKQIPFSTLISTIKKRILARNDNDYGRMQCHFVDKYVVRYVDAKFIYDRGDNVLTKDALIFPKHRLPTDKTQATFSDYCKGTMRKGVNLQRICDIGRQMKAHYVVPGNEGYVPQVMSVRGPPQTKHNDTSDLKHYLSCYIKDKGYDAYSIREEKWLNNPTLGTTILTGSFCTREILQLYDNMEKTGICGLFVLQTYRKNSIHIGDQFTCYTDDEGNTIGFNNEPKPRVWYDISDPFPFQGNFKKYGVTTLAIHGPQRIAVFRPVMEASTIDMTLDDKVTFAYQCVASKIKIPNNDSVVGLIPPPPDPDVDKEMRVYDNWTLLRRFTPRNVVQRVIRYIKYESAEWLPACTTAAATLGFAAGAVVATPFVVGVPLAPLAYATYAKVKKAAEECTIKFIVAPIVFKGSEKVRKALEWFYSFHFIDPVLKIPYGFYYVDDHQVIQVPQNDKMANYTNMPRFFMEYCMSKRFLMGNAIPTLKENVDCPVWLEKDSNDMVAFKDKEESLLEVIGSAANYQIEVWEKDIKTMSIHGHEELRQYLVPFIDKRTACAVASNRVLHGGVKPSLSRDAILKEMIEWYTAHSTKKFYEGVDTDKTPNYSHMTGKKWKSYDSCMANLTDSDLTVVHTTFVKSEALPAKAIHEKGPRIITMADKRTNLRIMNFTRAVEEVVYGFKYPSGDLKCAKHDSTDQQMTTIGNHASKYKWCFSCDAKNFDASIVGALALAELDFYHYLGLPKEMVDALINTKIKGVISHDVLQRFSGDMYTALGNVIIMSAVLHKYESRGCKYYCNGDDTLVFSNDIGIITDIIEDFKNHGVTLKVEAIGIGSDHYTEQPIYTIPFCQMYYEYDSYYNDPVRTMNRMCNLVGTTFHGLAKTILGKLQGHQYLKNIGYHFIQDPTYVLRGLPTDYRTEYKNKISEGSEFFDRKQDKTINYRDPIHGLLGHIVCQIVDNENRFLQMKPEKREKELIKFIERIIRDEYENESKLRPDIAQMLAKLDDYIASFGTQAVLPAIADQYETAIASMYGYTIKPIDWREVKLPEDTKVDVKVISPKFVDIDMTDVETQSNSGDPDDMEIDFAEPEHDKATLIETVQSDPMMIDQPPNLPDLKPNTGDDAIKFGEFRFTPPVFHTPPDSYAPSSPPSYHPEVSDDITEPDDPGENPPDVHVCRNTAVVYQDNDIITDPDDVGIVRDVETGELLPPPDDLYPEGERHYFHINPIGDGISQVIEISHIPQDVHMSDTDAHIKQLEPG